MLMIALAVAFVLSIGLIMWRMTVSDQRRTKTLRLIATEMGFRMVDDKTVYSFESPLFHVGNKGRNRMFNAMEGTVAGLRTVLFDLSYEYDQGGDDGNTTVTHSVAAFSLPNTELPVFSIARSNFNLRRARNKISFEVSPELSKRFIVIGNQQAAIRELLHPDFLINLVSANQLERLVIEGAGPWLIVYKPGNKVSAEQWKSFLAETTHIATTFTASCLAQSALLAR
jgi:hypothetical protein